MTDALHIVRGASTRRVELDTTSWVDVTEGFVADPEAELAHVLTTTTWRQREVLRYDRYVPERRLVAGLRSADHPLLRQATLHLESRHHVTFSGVAAIHYRDGNDFQGLHRDREMTWLDETLIAICVLGVRRPFVLRPNGTWNDPDQPRSGEGPDDVVLHPGAGDLIVLGGACQRDWLHGVPAAPTRASRVSLTWRWSSRRGRPDTDPKYSDGLHFADGPRRPGLRTRK